jgi:uncharacterized linocin/CFP29 family protein
MWSTEHWKDINDAVVNEVSQIRVAQKVFPTKVFENNPTRLPNDVINFGRHDYQVFSVDEGQTKPFVEIYQQFTLTTTQAAEDEEGESPHTCKTLARMAAKAAALREDAAFFSGEESNYPAGVMVNRIESMGDGLLGEADPPDADDDDATKVSKPIRVSPPEVRRRGILFGENVFSAVADGIAKLVGKAQAKPYALILPERVYANTFAPPGDQSLVTVAEMIEPLVEGGFYGTATLPENRGLLVALGGDPIKLYVGHEAAAEFMQQDKQTSLVFFRVMERVQFVARDPRALVRLDFDFDEVRRQDELARAAADGGERTPEPASPESS